MTSPQDPDPSRRRILEVAGFFLRLGLTAFGGPAAHVSLMRAEVVERRKWVDEQQFLDLFGMANAIPGPTSTEMAIYLGYQRAGWTGLILGGVCFILPAALIVTGLAWAYVRFGTAAQTGWLFYGIKPVVIAIVLQALWGLGRKAVKNWVTALAGLVVLTLYLFGVNVLILLAAGGVAVMLAGIFPFLRKRHRDGLPGISLIPIAGLSLPAAGAVVFSLPLLFLTFLKIGAVLYGSGYVLLAFLRADFVLRLGWLTDQQLVDAIAVGQVTPGPVFTTATFIGYLLGGLPGAFLATLGIFLPSFAFVAASYPLLGRLRSSPWASHLLDGVNVASLGLMAGVASQLGKTALVDPLTVGMAMASLLILFWLKINPTWLILAGALVGVIGKILLPLG